MSRESPVEILSVQADGSSQRLYAGSCPAGTSHLPIRIPFPYPRWILVRTRNGQILSHGTLQGTTLRLPASHRNRMRLVPGGIHRIGSDTTEPGRFSDETLHEVLLSSFWLDTTEVTHEEYAWVMGLPMPTRILSRQPITGIDWFQAILFCNALSRREGMDTTYEYDSLRIDRNGRILNILGLGLLPFANGYRLPTEAQWEAAARHGSITPWSWGSDSLDSRTYAWSMHNATGPKPVGLRHRDPWGFLDLTGNVWEWVQDWYGSYDTSLQTDPQGPSRSFYRVLRGGSWQSPATELRCAYRNGAPPDYRAGDVGFRCARPFR